MSSRNNLLTVVSTTLLASVCMPMSASAQIFATNGISVQILGSVTSNGTNMPAATASTGGSFHGSNASLTTTGIGSFGIQVETGGKAELTKVTVNTEGLGSHGLNIDGPGLIDLTDSSVDVIGQGAWGAHISGDGAELTLENTDIISVLHGGIRASNAADINMTGGSITTLGSPSHSSTAVELIDSKGYFGGVAIKTTAGGIKASGNSDAELTDVTITSTGDQSYGLSANSAVLTGENIVFTSNGEQSDGIRATNGSEVTVRNSSFTTDGVSANGVTASSGAKVEMSDSTVINVSGRSAKGVDARSGAEVIVDNSMITVTGTRSNYGVYATGTDTDIKIRNKSTINTAGSRDGYGVHSSAGAVVDIRDETVITASGDGLNVTAGGEITATDIDVNASLTGVSVSVTTAAAPAVVTISNSQVKSAGSGGIGRYGMFVVGTGAKIISTDVDLLTDGTGRDGFQAQDFGLMEMTGGSITTQKDTSSGGVVNAAKAVVNGTVITTSGKMSNGLSAHVQGDIELIGVEIKTSGADARGLNAFDDGYIHGEVDIETSGAGAHSVSAMLGGRIELKNSAILASGDGAAAIAAAQPANPGAEPFNGTGTITITDSSVRAENGASVLVEEGADLALTLIDTDLTINNGELFNVLFDGSMNASITNADLQGAALLGQGATSNLLLNNTSWLVTGNSDLTSLGGVNSSFINFAEPTGNPEAAGSYLTLTVGDYSSDNSTITFNTWLGDDGSPTDLLKVTGDTSGNTIVRVKNTSGAGQKTTSDGIMLIEVDGESNGQFELDQDYKVQDGRKVVVAGAYAYSLHKDGISEETGDWYLRSQLSETDPVDPLYQVGSPVYEVYPQLLLGLNGLPTLQQRVGNRYWNNAGNRILTQGADTFEQYAPAEEAGVLIETNGIWGRIEGSYTKIKSKTSTSSTDYDYNTFKMQAGLDGLLNETENGKLIGGVTVHYAHGKADVYSAHGDGAINTNGYGFGGTLTWYGENGLYVDNQAQLTWYDSDLHSNTADKALVHGNNGFGYALSIETGRRITIDENWSVTPQAQLVYSNVRFDDFTDTFNAHVSKKRADSLEGRLGISADYQNSWLNDQGQISRSSVYGIANLYNEFLDGTKVDVSNVSFINERERLWAGVGLGGSYNWNDDKYSIYGEGSVNTSLKNFGNSYHYKGTVGFRVKW